MYYPSNTEAPHASYAIALNPTGNLKISYRFLSLDTGERISRRCWTELPITVVVLAGAQALALAKQTYNPDAPKFLFKWAPYLPIGDVAENIQAPPQMLVLEEAAHTDADDEEDDDEEEEEEGDIDEEEENKDEEASKDEAEENLYETVGAQGVTEEALHEHNEEHEGAPEAPKENEGAR